MQGTTFNSSLALAGLTLATLVFGTSPATAQDRVRLAVEHVDIAADYEASTPGVHLYDEENATEYEVDAAELFVNTLASGVVFNPPSTQYNFLGSNGAPVYVIPFNQNPELPYLGISAGIANSQRDSYNAFDESGGRVTGTGRWVKMAVTGMTLSEGAEGGHFSIWQDVAGGPRILVDSFDGFTPDGTGLEVDAAWVASHTHYNFGFTREGVYDVNFRPSFYLNDGNTTSLGTYVEGEEFAVRFRVQAVPGPAPVLLMGLGSLLTGVRLLFRRRIRA